MEFFLNELSLHGQFDSIEKFKGSLDEILECRKIVQKSGFRLYCSNLQGIEIRKGLNFQKAIQKLSRNNKDYLRQIMSWLSKDGLFRVEDREHSEDDYILIIKKGENDEEKEEVITGSSLAEAAWRRLNGTDTFSVSFAPSSYDFSPLKIQYCKTDTERQEIEIENFWKSTDLNNFLQENTPGPESWEEMLKRSVNEFSLLQFSPAIITILKTEPFSKGIAERILELLKILNTLILETNDKGKRTEAGLELYNNYFKGDKAIFTDESNTNKEKFKRKLTFPDPENHGSEIFCPWHGKIRFGKQYRIHFERPPQQNAPLYIAYIGPKITKE